MLHITNLIQLMMRLGIQFVGTVKNTAAFPFIIHDHNLEKTKTFQNKVVLQSYGIRSHFSCCTKIGTEMKVSVLRNGIGKIRSARIATNVPLLMENSWVYELSSGDLGSIDIKRNTHETALCNKTSSNIEEKIILIRSFTHSLDFGDSDMLLHSGVSPKESKTSRDWCNVVSPSKL